MSTYSTQNNQPITTLCRCCARQVVFFQDENLRECAACGMLNARPQSTGKTFDFLQRANQQRSSCDFTNAEASYQHVLQEHPTEHEALWGLALCRYGVEYIEDPKTQMLMPTCHFTRRKPLMEDSDYLLACENAPASVRLQYEADAQYIDAIQAGIRASAKDCLPFDVFICHKATVPGTDMRPSDFEYARSLYYKLTQMGYQTFFAHETLQHVAGANYEARIYHALHTAKVMLVICTREDYLNTAWVRSEWSRYLERMDADGDCVLVPLLYDGMVPEALPAPFSHRNLEGLRMGELDSLEKLTGVLQTHIPPKGKAAPQSRIRPQAKVQKQTQATQYVDENEERVKQFFTGKRNAIKTAIFHPDQTMEGYLTKQGTLLKPSVFRILGALTLVTVIFIAIVFSLQALVDTICFGEVLLLYSSISAAMLFFALLLLVCHCEGSITWRIVIHSAIIMSALLVPMIFVDYNDSGYAIGVCAWAAAIIYAVRDISGFTADPDGANPTIGKAFLSAYSSGTVAIASGVIGFLWDQFLNAISNSDLAIYIFFVPLIALCALALKFRLRRAQHFFIALVAALVPAITVYLASISSDYIALCVFIYFAVPALAYSLHQKYTNQS